MAAALSLCILGYASLPAAATAGAEASTDEGAPVPAVVAEPAAAAQSPAEATEPATPVAVSSAAVDGASPPPSPIPMPLPARPFGVGEKLEFSIQYGPIKAGTATLAVEAIEEVDGHMCYRVASVARSNRIFDAFYKTRDRVESYIDIAELMPWRSAKHLHEKDYRRDEVLEWDHAQGLVRYSNGDSAAIEPGTRDILGAFYLIRTLDLDVDDRIPLQVHDSHKTYELWIEVTGAETIDTPLGRFDCLIAEPQLESEGLFRRTGSLTVWLTRDDTHMPVMMQSKVKVGAISAILVGMERGQPAARFMPSANAN